MTESQDDDAGVIAAGASRRLGRPESSSRAAAARGARAAHRDAVGAGEGFDALCVQLQRARDVEQAADTGDRRQAARAGGTANSGGVCGAVAGRRRRRRVGVTSGTVLARLRSVDQSAPAGITVPAPPRLTAPRRRPAISPVEDGWLTPGQACAVAGVRHRSLTRWRLAGLLPGSRCTQGGRWFYRREDLERVTALRAGRKGLPPGTFT